MNTTMRRLEKALEQAHGQRGAELDAQFTAHVMAAVHREARSARESTFVFDRLLPPVAWGAGCAAAAAGAYGFLAFGALNETLARAGLELTTSLLTSSGLF